MVLFNHTGTNGFLLFTVAQYSPVYPVYLFLAVVIKIAVPLFFMISGALLLEKDEPYRELWKNRIGKYLIVLASVSLLVYISKNYSDFSIDGFLRTIYGSQASTGLWYLYAYLGFLFMLPLTRKLARNMNDADYRWLMIIYAGMQVLSIGEFLVAKGTLTYNGNFSLFVLKSNVFYPLMGYYIEHKLENNSREDIRLMIMWLLSVIAIRVCCLMTHYRCSLTNQWSEANSQTFLGTLAFVPAITVFYTAKAWFAKHTINEKTESIITTIGGTTFGIYLFEEIYRWITRSVFILLDPYVPTLVASCVWVLAACMLGGFITYFMKKIPVVKRFL